jgi:hypothetical protein
LFSTFWTSWSWTLQHKLDNCVTATGPVSVAPLSCRQSDALGELFFSWGGGVVVVVVAISRTASILVGSTVPKRTTKFPFPFHWVVSLSASTWWGFELFEVSPTSTFANTSFEPSV